MGVPFTQVTGPTPEEELRMKTWDIFCTALQHENALPALCLVVPQDESCIETLCKWAYDDHYDNPNVYVDMMALCIDYVRARGYVNGPRHGTNLPAIPPYPSPLVDLANHTVELHNVESHDIIEALKDIVIHYLGWCKKLIFDYWQMHNIHALNVLLQARHPNEYQTAIIYQAQQDVPENNFPLPRPDTVGPLIVPVKVE